MAEKKRKVIGKGTVKNNLFKATTDVFVETNDKRRLLVARKGQSISVKRAITMGVVDPKALEKKKASAKSNKAKEPAENKSK